MSKPSFAAVALVAAVSFPGAASAQGTVGALTGVITDAAGSALAKPLSGNEERVLLAYLSTNYPAAPGSAKPKPDPFSRLPRTLLPPEARGYMVVEYELTNPRAEPHEIAVDSEGNGFVS